MCMHVYAHVYDLDMEPNTDIFNANNKARCLPFQTRDFNREKQIWQQTFLD